MREKIESDKPTKFVKLNWKQLCRDKNKKEWAEMWIDVCTQNSKVINEKEGYKWYFVAVRKNCYGIEWEQSSDEPPTKKRKIGQSIGTENLDDKEKNGSDQD